MLNLIRVVDFTRLVGKPIRSEQYDKTRLGVWGRYLVAHNQCSLCVIVIERLIIARRFRVHISTVFNELFVVYYRREIDLPKYIPSTGALTRVIHIWKPASAAHRLHGLVG